MKDTTQRILKYLFVALAVLAGLLLLFLNRNLASLAEWIYPGSEIWTHIVLVAVEVIAFLRLWHGLFGGQRHLLLMDEDSPEEQRHFAEELARRMRKNPLIIEAGITPEGKGPIPESEYLERCLALLDAKANAEIEQNAKRIFLATALSQNGRLDALIVFVSLCRLVWRVSAIYNQQPHPREIASLYLAVASSTFLALSLEELDISTEITVGFGEAFHAMVPAGLTASIPFAGKALQTFTASTIDGAANCYLALRAGIITRNAYAYGMRKEEKPSRTAVFKEAGALLLAMSTVLVDKLASVLAVNLVGVARLAGGKTVQAGKGIVEGLGKVGQEIGSSAGRLATETVTVVQTTGRDLTEACVSTGNSTWTLISKPFRRKKTDGE